MTEGSILSSRLKKQWQLVFAVQSDKAFINVHRFRIVFLKQKQNMAADMLDRNDIHTEFYRRQGDIAGLAGLPFVIGISRFDFYSPLRVTLIFSRADSTCATRSESLLTPPS